MPEEGLVELLAPKLLAAAVAIAVTYVALQVGVRKLIFEGLVRRNVVTASTAEQMYKPVEAILVGLAALTILYLLSRDPVAAAALVTLIACLGAASWPLASNVLAFYALLLSHRIRAGDVVSVDGMRGRVVRVTPLYTVLRGRDGQTVVVPNRRLLDATFERASTGPVRVRLRVELALPRSRGGALVQLGEVESRLRAVLQARRLIQKGQDVAVAVTRLEPGRAVVEVSVPLPSPEPRAQAVNVVVKHVVEALAEFEPRVEVADAGLLQ